MEVATDQSRLIKVATHQNSNSSKQQLIKVATHQSGNSSNVVIGGSFMKLMIDEF